MTGRPALASSSASRAAAMPAPTTTVSSSCRHRAGTDLELRHPAGRVEGVVGQPVGADPVERHEDRVRPDRGDHPGRGLELAAPGGDQHRLAVVRPDAVGQHRVQLDVRPVVGEVADPAGLGARLVLAEHPAGGEVQREVVVDRLGRATVLDGDEPGPPVGVGEPVGEQPRRAGCPTSGHGQKTPCSARIRS